MLLKKKDADILFLDHCFFIGGQDAILITTACDLLGYEPIEYAGRKETHGTNWNVFYIGSEYRAYLTYTGFMDAVSYYNFRAFPEAPATKLKLNENKKPCEILQFKKTDDKQPRRKAQKG